MRLKVGASGLVVASQIFTVPSMAPEANRVPSGLKTTLVTTAGVPLEGKKLLAGLGVPDLHPRDPLARRLPSGLKATLLTALSLLEGEEFLAGLRIPHLHRTAPPGQAFAVGAEGHAGHAAP